MKLGGEIRTEKLTARDSWLAYFPIGSKLIGRGPTEEAAVKDLCQKRIDQYLDHDSTQ